MTAFRGFKSYVAVKLDETPVLTGRLTQKEITLLKAATKERKAITGRHLFNQSDERLEQLKEDLPPAREARRLELGLDKLTVQQQFGVLNEVNTLAWNKLSVNEKSEWSQKARDEVNIEENEGNT